MHKKERSRKRKNEDNERRSRASIKTIPKILSTTIYSIMSIEVENKDDVEIANLENRKKHFITEKIVAILHRCQFSIRECTLVQDAAFMIATITEALEHNIDVSDIKYEYFRKS